MRVKCYLIILLITALYPTASYSYNDTKTHRELTEVAITMSTFKDYLKNIFNIERNSSEENKIITSFQDGATNEDIPYRAYNHFYNPLTGEGLDDSAGKIQGTERYRGR